MGPCRVVAAVFSVMALGLAVASLAFHKDNWYKVEGTLASAQVNFNVGVLYSCDDGTCSINTYADDITQTGTEKECTRTGAKRGARVASCFALVCLGGLLSAVVALLAVASPSKATGTIRIAVSFVSFASYATSLTLFYWTVARWLYCDQSFCKFTGADCSTEGPTLYFYFGCGAGGAALIAFAACLVDVVTRPKEETEATAPKEEGGTKDTDAFDGVPRASGADQQEDSADPKESSTETAVPDVVDKGTNKKPGDDDQQPPTKQATTSSSSAPPSTERRQSNAKATEYATPPTAADTPQTSALDDEAEWLWYEEHQMYWSDKVRMYLEPDSGWYYDPSGWWYDPETEQWVEAAED